MEEPSRVEEFVPNGGLQCDSGSNLNNVLSVGAQISTMTAVSVMETVWRCI